MLSHHQCWQLSSLIISSTVLGGSAKVQPLTLFNIKIHFWQKRLPLIKYWLMAPLSHSYTVSLLTSVNYASFFKCEQVNGGALVCWLMRQFVILCAKFLSHVKILVVWLKKKEIWNTFSVCWVRQIVCKVHLSPSMHFLNPEFGWKHPQETQGRARETLGCFS